MKKTIDEISLRASLRRFSTMTSAVLRAKPEIYDITFTPFETLTSIWLLDATATNSLEIENAKSRYREVGFDGDSVVAEVRSLLAKDTQLNQCCAGLPRPLISWMSRFVDRFSDGLSDEFPEDRFEQESSAFAEMTYSRPFAVHLYRRLYNFEAETPVIDLGRFEIVKLQPAEIRSMLRDESIFQMFHSPGTGDHYLHATISSDPILDPIPMNAAQNDSLGAISVLRYFKDGYVDSDYVLTVYEPFWVNSIRKVTPYGRIHSLPYADGTRVFTISTQEVESFREWMELYFGKVQQHLLDQSGNDMGKRLNVAIEFFASSFSEETEEKRLIDLMVAFESLFSPNDKSELSFRICLYASQLVGSTSAERAQNFKFLKRMYGIRSEFVHGTLPMAAYLDNKFVATEDNDKLSGILRQAILRLLTLSLNGRTNLAVGPASVHSELANAVFDPVVGDAIRRYSDFETAISLLRSRTLINRGPNV